MLSTMTPYGYFPYAGIPWFYCPFGRDGLIAALEFLPLFPEVARGTLKFWPPIKAQRLSRLPMKTRQNSARI